MYWPPIARPCRMAVVANWPICCGLCAQAGDGLHGVQRHVAGKCQCSPSPPRQHGDQIYEVFCRAALIKIRLSFSPICALFI